MAPEAKLDHTSQTKDAIILCQVQYNAIEYLLNSPTHPIIPTVVVTSGLERPMLLLRRPVRNSIPQSDPIRRTGDTYCLQLWEVAWRRLVCRASGQGQSRADRTRSPDAAGCCSLLQYFLSVLLYLHTYVLLAPLPIPSSSSAHPLSSPPSLKGSPTPPRVPHQKPTTSPHGTAPPLSTARGLRSAQPLIPFRFLPLLHFLVDRIRRQKGQATFAVRSV
jgi:hypothetical protein